MFTKNNITYSEAGKILVTNNRIGYEIPTLEIEGNIREESVILDDMKLITGKFISFSKGRVIMLYHPEFSYADWKTEIIKSRYSNDSQIALILNREDSEEDAILFQKMQEWRNWASVVAKKIIALK